MVVADSVPAIGKSKESNVRITRPTQSHVTRRCKRVNVLVMAKEEEEEEEVEEVNNFHATPTTTTTTSFFVSECYCASVGDEGAETYGRRAPLTPSTLAFPVLDRS